MRAVISVVGKNDIGILADVSGACANVSADVLEVTQTILQDMFTMFMLVEVSEGKSDLKSLQDELEALSKKRNLVIHAMHEDIFNAMHEI
ncbi:MAG: ACT domain-containing protein [Erysipelotrichales bacterium]|nr:ACT domain-containing protein [Erysipelotrichales bacterium]